MFLTKYISHTCTCMYLVLLCLTPCRSPRPLSRCLRPRLLPSPRPPLSRPQPLRPAPLLQPCLLPPPPPSNGSPNFHPSSTMAAAAQAARQAAAKMAFILCFHFQKQWGKKCVCVTRGVRSNARVCCLSFKLVAFAFITTIFDSDHWSAK